MSAYGYSPPATARCPGCGAIVVLPKEPIFADSPPAICATCDTEVPDYRRSSYTASDARAAEQPPVPAPAAPAAPSVPVEQQRYSRGRLFRSLGGLIAERGLTAVESAKDRFPS